MTWAHWLGEDFWWIDAITHSGADTPGGRIREYTQMECVYEAQGIEAQERGNLRQQVFCQYKAKAYRCAARNERLAMHEGRALR